MGGESRRGRILGSFKPAPKEQFPRNSQVPVLIHVSTLESGTTVSTDGENHGHIIQADGKSLRFYDRGGDR